MINIPPEDIKKWLSSLSEKEMMTLLKEVEEKGTITYNGATIEAKLGENNGDQNH